MNRKGLFETIALAVVTMMLVGVFSVLGTKFLVDLNKIIRRETVGLAGTRVSTTIYAAGSMEKANTQINFPYGYDISETDYDSDGDLELTISFTYNDKTETAVVKSAQWMGSDFGIGPNINSEGRVRNYCLKTRGSDQDLYTGRC